MNRHPLLPDFVRKRGRFVAVFRITLPRTSFHRNDSMSERDGTVD